VGFSVDGAMTGLPVGVSVLVTTGVTVVGNAWGVLVGLTTGAPVGADVILSVGLDMGFGV